MLPKNRDEDRALLLAFVQWLDDYLEEYLATNPGDPDNDRMVDSFLGQHHASGPSQGAIPQNTEQGGSEPPS